LRAVLTVGRRVRRNTPGHLPPERREEVVRFLDAEVVDSGGADRSAPPADLPG
jgi:hypothetical protein